MLILILCRQKDGHTGRDTDTDMLVGYTFEILPKSYLNRITAPAHVYATDAVVYMALLYQLKPAKVPSHTFSFSFFPFLGSGRRDEVL